MEIVKKICIISFLLVLYIYVSYFSFLPNSYIIIQGEELKIPILPGVKIYSKDVNNTIQTVSNNTKTKVNEVGKNNFTLKLFNIFKIKNYDVNVISKTKVVPLGNAIGMKLYTDGVLVVGMSEIEGKKPYEKTGIKEGDRIVEINNNKIKNTQDLIKQVNKSNGNSISIKYIREKEITTVKMLPIKGQDNKYKLGLWVRDAAAGVGTLTFYEPTTKSFATLGHGIIDIDTSKLLKISNGKLVTTKILDIQKGEKGKPGEIKGSIENGKTIGKISKNTNFGVFGTLENLSYINSLKEKELEVALRNEIKKGRARNNL